MLHGDLRKALGEGKELARSCATRYEVWKVPVDDPFSGRTRWEYEAIREGARAPDRDALFVCSVTPDGDEDWPPTGW